MIKFTAALLAATSLALPSTAAADNHGQQASATGEAAPLIPRESLFGNPTRTGGQISPDGKWLSWRAP